MKLRSSTWFVALFVVGVVCSAAAVQKAPTKSGTLSPPVLKGTYESSPIDTRSFFPQIDNEVVFHRTPPLNPHVPLIRPGPQNKLKPGKVGDSSRIGSAQLFPAIGFTGWYPPDPTMAVGLNHIVTTVNSSIAFYTRDGTQEFERTTSDFFAGLGAGSFIYDPKVRYDRVHDRFVIVFLEEDDASTTSKVLLAVSASGDPNGTWYRYRLEAKLTVGSVSFWFDYPGVGYDKDAYVVTGNMFGFDGFSYGGVQFLVLPVAPLLKGSTAVMYSMVDPNAFTVQDCETIDPTFQTIYSVTAQDTADLGLYAFDTTSMPPSSTFITISVPQFETPSIDVTSTNNETIDALDGRMLNCVLRNGHMLADHCVQSGNQLIARWYDINMGTWPTSGSPTLAQSGDVASDTLDYWMPAINMNARGDISMIFSAASSSVTADTVITGRVASDPVGQMGVPITLQSSDGNDYGLWRWGDFFAVDVDPVDDTTFWGISMDVDPSNMWRTQIFNWIITSTFPTVQSIVVNPTSVIGGSPSTGTVTLSSIAPPGGMKVTLSSSNPKVASVPGGVTVKNGATSFVFGVKTTPTTVPVIVTITATTSKSTASTQLTVAPLGIESLTLNPTQVASGNPSTGTVVLGGPAGPGGTVVLLAVDNSTVASVEWNLQIPAGQTTGTFTVTTKPVGVTTSVVVRAANPGPTKYATLTLLPTMALSSVSVSPATVRGGNSATGTVSLTATAPSDILVTLGSNNGSLIVPTTVKILSGHKSAAFTVKTTRVRMQQFATLTAAYSGVQATTKVTINP